MVDYSKFAGKIVSVNGVQVIPLNEIFKIIVADNGTTVEDEIKSYNLCMRGYTNVSDLEFKPEFDQYEEVK